MAVSPLYLFAILLMLHLTGLETAYHSTEDRLVFSRLYKQTFLAYIVLNLSAKTSDIQLRNSHYSSLQNIY